MPKINFKSSSKKISSLRKNILLTLTVAALTTAGWWYANRLDLAFGKEPDINAITAKKGDTCKADGKVKEGGTRKEENKENGTITYYTQYFKCVAVAVYPKKVVPAKSKNNKKDIVDDKKARPITVYEWKFDHEERYVKKLAQCTYKGKGYKPGTTIVENDIINCKRDLATGAVILDAQGRATCQSCDTICDPNGAVKQKCKWDEVNQNK